MNFPMSFIKAGEEFSTLNKHAPAPYFRRSFVIEELPYEAYFLITGLGFYDVYINGENITKGYLAPYRSNIDHMIYYDEYFITSKLKKGKNTIGIILGNGMRNAQGAFVWDFDKARFRGAPETAFSLELKYHGRETKWVLSDEKTLTHPSPILFDDLHYGEYYDARLEIPNWNMPEFDDSSWKNAVRAELPRGEARLCSTEPIRVRSIINAVSVTECDGGFIYDFGVNTAGICRLKIKGFSGQRVLMQFFELLHEGKPYLRNNRFRDEDRFQEDEYYLSGNGVEEYTPKFTYHGFRYAYVTGITKQQATPDLLTYLELSSDLKSAGEFTCSDDTVNKIQQATLRSDISNFYYFPTDCPQREKNGWTGDATLSAEQLLLNFHSEVSSKEWMKNIYKSITPEGSLPGIVPTDAWGFGQGPAWDNVLVNVPYHIYVYRGDKEVLQELSSPLMRYLDYLMASVNEEGLVNTGLGDWCQVDRSAEKYDTPLVVSATISAYDTARKAAFVYDVLEKPAQKAFAEHLASGLRSAFREKLINSENCEVLGNTQTAQAMAIYYGMFEECEKPKAAEVLVRYIEQNAGHFNTGVLGARAIYRALADCGYAELAFNMITRPDHPSYGNWIARGATTLWEAFSENDLAIGSMNHHFWGDVSAWFYIYLAGIRINPTGRDVRNFDIKPCFIERLDNAKGCYDTPNGRISVEWERNSDRIKLCISCGTEHYGEIHLPEGYLFEDGSAKKGLRAGKFEIIRR